MYPCRMTLASFLDPRQSSPVTGVGADAARMAVSSKISDATTLSRWISWWPVDSTASYGSQVISPIQRTSYWPCQAKRSQSIAVVAGYVARSGLIQISTSPMLLAPRTLTAVSISRHRMDCHRIPSIGLTEPQLKISVT